MLTLSLEIKLHASWIYSLKKKRMVAKSLLFRIWNEFNVAVAGVGEQDIHQTIVIDMAAIVSHNTQANSVMEEIRYLIEENTEAEITDMERKIF